MSKVSIEELLDQLEDTIENGTSLAFTSKTLINAHDVMELIKEMRLNIPDEIRQAQIIASERVEILESAEKQADGIISKAQKQAQALVAEHVITRQAQDQAHKLVAQANAQAAQIMSDANEEAESTKKQAQRWSDTLRDTSSDFVENMLLSAQDALENSLTNIRRVKTNFDSAQVTGSGRTLRRESQNTEGGSEE